jgi:hypothetical protein
MPFRFWGTNRRIFRVSSEIPTNKWHCDKLSENQSAALGETTLAQFLKRFRIEAYFGNRLRLTRWLLASILGLAAWTAAPTIAALAQPKDYAAQLQLVSELRIAGQALFALASLALLFLWAFIPSDRQIDQWAASYWRTIGDWARQKFSLDTDEIIEDPIEFRYYSLEKAQACRGKDNLWRSTQLAATVINSTRQQFMIYLCRIDLLTGNFTYEETHEIFYQDIVSISTSAKSRIIDMKNASDYDKDFARKYPRSVVNNLLQINDLKIVALRLVNDGHITIAAYRDGGTVSYEDDLGQLASNADAVDRLRRCVRDMREFIAQNAVLATTKQFFREALGCRQEQIGPDLLRFVLPDSVGNSKEVELTGIVAIWDEQRSTTLLMTLKNLKRTDGDGIARLYLLHNQGRPPPKILHEWRRELEWEVVPVHFEMIARAVSRHESERVLKELEEPYLTRTDPYLESKPIIDPTWFFGRREVLDRLTSILAQGQHAGIFGLRKIGKTSLIKQIEQRFGRTPTALVDCQEFGAFANVYLQEISGQLREELSVLGVGSVPPPLDRFEDLDVIRKYLFDLVQAWRASGREEPFLIIMDEIDKLFPCHDITTEEPVVIEYVRLFRMLRGLAQTQNCIVMLVVAYRPDVNRRNLLTAKSGENPMFRSYHEEYVGCLSADESEALVREVGQWRQIDWEQEAAFRVYRYCGGHPLITRIFASKVTERGTRKHITVARTEETALEIAQTFRKNDIGNYYSEGIWKLLHENERNLLETMTRSGDDGLVESDLGATLQEALTNLENFGLVRVDDSRVRIVAELFNRWLKRMF